MKAKRFFLVAFFLMVMVAVAAYAEDNPYKIPGQSTSAGPALAVFKGRLYCAYKANDGRELSDIWVTSTSDGASSSWGSFYNTGQTTSAGPALAVFNDKLYCIYKANMQSNEIRVTSTSDGASSKSWGSPYNIHGQSTSAGPALAVFKGRLYCAYKANDGRELSDIWVTSTSDGASSKSWGSFYNIPGQATSVGPALAVFNDKLYCIYKANMASNEIWVTSTSDGASSKSWVPPYNIPGQTTSAGPALAVFNDKLYCIYKANMPSNEIWVTSTCACYEGCWRSFAIIPGQTSAGPALAVFNNKLYCVYKASDPRTNAIYVTSTSVGTSWGSSYYIPGRSTSAGPALAVFNNELYCVYKANDPLNAIWVTSTCACYEGCWRSAAIIPAQTSAEPALAVFNDKLYCVYKATMSSNEIWVHSNSKTDAANW